jgi:hypothetical protein
MIFQLRANQAIAIVAASFAAIALALVFMLSPDVLLSARDSDMTSEFVSWRAYLAETLHAGHLPLWNPFTYAGQPFLGGFESAVLYPPNLLFAFMPLARALNFSMLLHLIILGWGMAQWALTRGLHPWAAGLAGLVVPLTGAVFPHLYAGHLSNICTMAWVPWTFLGLEVWTRQGGYRWLLLASAAVCLQILAGQVQYCFFAAVAAGAQAILISATDPAARRRAFPGVVFCYLGATALGAAQLLPGMVEAAEGTRQQTLDYSFASMFGFPPENLLTTIAPTFFGGRTQSIYWGRSYFWEMSLFIGASGLLLIAVALFDKNRKLRELGCDLVLVGLLLVIALGVHTPLFKPLYDFVPGLGHFRGWSKFIFPAALFLVLLIATGADTLLRGDRPRQAALTGVFLGFATSGAGAILVGWPQSIKWLFLGVLMSGENYLPIPLLSQPYFIQHAGRHAGLSLGLAGLILLAMGIILLLINRWPFLRWGALAVLPIEMLGFAATQITTSHLSDAMPDSLRQFIAARPGDYRVLNLFRPNNGFLLGASDLGGNNPGVLRRYAEFITYTQGGDPDHVTQYLSITKVHPRYSMLRLRYIFGPLGVTASPYPPMPRLLLVSDWQVLNGRDAIFSALNDPRFNPSTTVLMESEPEPRPELGATGSATLMSALPDALTIEVDTDKPTLLLITDLYARGWRAEPLSGSVQQSYQLAPADYILRVVPLMAGHHRLRVVFAPTSFLVGIGISAVAWTLWAIMFYFASWSTTLQADQ